MTVKDWSIIERQRFNDLKKFDNRAALLESTLQKGDRISAEEYQYLADKLREFERLFARTYPKI